MPRRLDAPHRGDTVAGSLCGSIRGAPDIWRSGTIEWASLRCWTDVNFSRLPCLPSSASSADVAKIRKSLQIHEPSARVSKK